MSDKIKFPFHISSKNWAVYKNGVLLYVTHKTALSNVIDKLVRSAEDTYAIYDFTDSFIKIEKEDVVDPNGSLNLILDSKISVNIDTLEYLSKRYGDVVLEDNVYKISSDREQLLARARNKFSEEEWNILVGALKNENQ